MALFWCEPPIAFDIEAAIAAASWLCMFFAMTLPVPVLISSCTLLRASHACIPCATAVTEAVPSMSTRVAPKSCDSLSVRDCSASTSPTRNSCWRLWAYRLARSAVRPGKFRRIFLVFCNLSPPRFRSSKQPSSHLNALSFVRSSSSGISLFWAFLTVAPTV